MSEPKDFIEHVLAQNPKFADHDAQRDAVIAYARECEAENARLRERAEALAGALTRIAEGDAESYLSCPGVPICSRTHDDNCAVGIAAAALRAYREASETPQGRPGSG